MDLVVQARGHGVEADRRPAGGQAAHRAAAAAGPAVVAVIGHAAAGVEAEGVVVVGIDIGLGVAGRRERILVAGIEAGLQASDTAADVDEAAHAALVALVVDHRQRHRTAQRVRHDVHLGLAGVGLHLVDEGLDQGVGIGLVVVDLRVRALVCGEIGHPEQFAVVVARGLQFLVLRACRRGVPRYRARRHVEADRAVAISVQEHHGRARCRAAAATESAVSHAGRKAAGVLRLRALAQVAIVGAAVERRGGSRPACGQQQASGDDAANPAVQRDET